MLKLGLALLAIGAVALVAYGGYYFVTLFLLDPAVPIIVRVGVAAVVLGVLIMLLAVIWERYRDMAREPFKGVKK